MNRRTIQFMVLLSLTLHLAFHDRVQAQDTICAGLQALHATHGNSLQAYLSAEGRECLVPEVTPSSAPEIQPLWSAKGVGETAQSLTLDLTHGVYKLNAPVSPTSNPAGSAYLREIITVPEDCIPWGFMSFPATLRVEGSCRLYATMRVDFGFSIDRTTKWELTITKKSEDLPPLPKAELWSAQGRGVADVPVELTFEPGIYRVAKQSGPDYAYLRVWSDFPRRCLRDHSSASRLPSQFKVSKTCQIVAMLNVGLSGSAPKSWSFDIMKLD